MHVLDNGFNLIVYGNKHGYTMCSNYYEELKNKNLYCKIYKSLNPNSLSELFNKKRHTHKLWIFIRNPLYARVSGTIESIYDKITSFDKSNIKENIYNNFSILDNGHFNYSYLDIILNLLYDIEVDTGLDNVNILDLDNYSKTFDNIDFLKKNKVFPSSFNSNFSYKSDMINSKKEFRKIVIDLIEEDEFKTSNLYLLNKIISIEQNIYNNLRERYFSNIF